LQKIKHFTRKPLDLINTFSKAAGYKKDIQKSAAFLYNSNEHAEKEKREQFHLQ
jgi:hypothetical protein